MNREALRNLDDWCASLSVWVIALSDAGSPLADDVAEDVLGLGACLDVAEAIAISLKKVPIPDLELFGE